MAKSNSGGSSPVDNMGSGDTGQDPASMLARLEELEQKITERDQKIEQLETEAQAVADSGGLKYSPDDQAFAGPNGGYKFRVTPKLKDGEVEFSHLKPATVQCVDESEALRWYCHSNEMKPGSGRSLDPMKVHLQVECLSRERADNVMRQKQISALRLKVERGNTLSDKDRELLATCEDEIYGYST